jgi:hypothetical protein
MSTLFSVYFMKSDQLLEKHHFGFSFLLLTNKAIGIGRPDDRVNFVSQENLLSGEG